jgi:AcrR family transcriptional regulator
VQRRTADGSRPGPAAPPDANARATAFRVDIRRPLTQDELRYTFAVTDTQHEVRRRPGGRSERIRRSVIEATMAVLRDRGWDRFSIAEVASRAGVHETSIYRRWGTRERLATDALLETGEQDLPVPDTGSLRGDLAGFAAGICQYVSTPLGLALARAMATPTGDPAITEASARYFQTRFEIASVIVDRAIARGEIPAGADAALALEMLIAPLHFRTLVSHQPLDDELPGRLADLVISGLRGHAGATPQPG